MECEQKELGLEAPAVLYVDGAYVDSETLPQAQVQGRKLRGPAPASPDRGKVFTVEAFDIRVEDRCALCPAGVQGPRTAGSRYLKLMGRKKKVIAYVKRVLLMPRATRLAKAK